MEEERLRLEWISASEAEKFRKTIMSLPKRLRN